VWNRAVKAEHLATKIVRAVNAEYLGTVIFTNMEREQ
jgi:hypothetical protein